MIGLGTSFYTGSGRHNAKDLQQHPFLLSQGLDGAVNAQPSWSELCHCWLPCRSMNTCTSLYLHSIVHVDMQDRVVSVRCSESSGHLGPDLSLCGSNDPLTGTVQGSAGQACLQPRLSMVLGKAFIIQSCLADDTVHECG